MQSTPPSALRKRVEAALRASRPEIAGMSAEEIRKLVHELQARQIELSVQNEELRASQADLAPVAYVTIDETGTIAEANLTAATMLGVERQRLVCRKFTQFVAPDGQDVFDRHQRAALDCGDKQAGDLLMRRQDGTTFYARMETVCFRDSVSRTPLCRSAIIDISRQMAAEAALVEGKQQLSGLIESAMDAIVSVDAGMRVILFNHAAEKMFQCPAAEAMGRPLDRFLPARFRERHAAHVERFGEAGETSRKMGSLGSVIGLREDGREFPVEASISHIETDGKKVYTVILRDITSRVRDEAALQRQAQLLHLSHDAILVWSTNGGIEFCSQGATRLYGYEHGELMGREPQEVLKSDYGQPWTQIESDLRERGLWEGTLRHTAKSGDEVVVSSRMQKIASEEGKGMVILESDRDITERQRLEAALLGASEEERQRIGRDLHDGLGQELTGIALLNSMLLNSLKAKRLPEAASAERLAELLAHAAGQVRRVSHGLQPVAPDPDSLMTGLKILMDDANFANASRCVFACDDKVAVHNHDTSNHLYRIAQEAVQNALRHGKPQKVIVSLTRRDGRVILEIQDDGVGFEPTETKSQGIGLGTMKYRAETMNGFLEFIQPRKGGALVRCSVPDPQPAP